MHNNKFKDTKHKNDGHYMINRHIVNYLSCKNVVLCCTCLFLTQEINTEKKPITLT